MYCIYILYIIYIILNYIYYCLVYILYIIYIHTVGLNSFILAKIRELKFSFTKLSQTSCLSVAGPMWGNNASFEVSIITCQIIINSFMVALQTCSQHHRTPSQDRLLLVGYICKAYPGATPFKTDCHLYPFLHATFAKILV